MSLDGEPYHLMNCEIILETNILFATFYINEETGDIIGGVTYKKLFDEYLQIDSRGFLIERWSFASIY